MTLSWGSVVLGFIAGLTVGEVVLFFCLAIVRKGGTASLRPSLEAGSYFAPVSPSLSHDPIGSIHLKV
jgi:hypothetical protein